MVFPVDVVPIGVGANYNTTNGQLNGLLGIGDLGYEKNGNSNFIGVDQTTSISLYFGIQFTFKAGFKW